MTGNPSSVLPTGGGQALLDPSDTVREIEQIIRRKIDNFLEVNREPP